jgi:hypothetical protein
MAQAAPAGTGELIEQAELPIEVLAQYPTIRGSRFFTEYCTRLANNRDMHTIVTAEGETGVGKTTLAFSICMLLDPHGWSAEKATLDPREYAYKYDDHPKGSWLLGDEWEQAMDARTSSSKDNRELSHHYAGKRYRQIFSCVTLPSKNWLDKRLSISSADFWIQCLEGKAGQPKGQARVYRLKEEEHYETSITKRTELMTWPVLETHPELKKVHRLKVERFEGPGPKSAYVSQQEVEDLKQNYWKKATHQARYGLIKGMSRFGLSHGDIAEILTMADHVDGLSRQRVQQLDATESFEEAYSYG